MGEKVMIAPKEKLHTHGELTCTPEMQKMSGQIFRIKHSTICNRVLTYTLKDEPIGWSWVSKWLIKVHDEWDE